jgi:alpha/beta superfamily hydrolase
MSGDIRPPRPIEVQTSDGCTLHGDLAVPAEPLGAVSVLHPHPRMGGDRHNAVVDALFRALPRAGFAVLRLDFRGVGRSTGAYDGGVGERLDGRAALDALAHEASGLPLWSAGYSFGGDVALSIDHEELAGWVAVAPPLAVLADEPPAARAGRPTVLVVPAHDQFGPPDAARRATEGWHDTTVVEVPMADHFLAGRLDTTVGLVLGALTSSG